MSHADLTLTGWSGLSDEAALRTATAIAGSTQARLTGIGAHAYAGRSGRVAFFERDDLRYALVPGGTVALGFDPDRFTPSARQVADFAEAEVESALTAFLAEMTSPARTVTLPARLVAVSSEVTDTLLPDGVDDHAELIAALGRRGLRPPSPDEWEHACGAGATTLFRWGSDYPAGEPYGKVPLIQDPNLLGLLIGDDPYRSEFTTDPAVLCGGDGGSALCGGSGPFLSWLSVATAFRDPDLAEVVQEGGLTGETPIRPVLEIP
ncbi:hypothetical protein [Actinoplanes awajinensis]|uniref:Sulfatase-modifying factor enzyme domain-containing protein n=1 Tax=Actinoplanes awajinensis subsp. mycoplanecinus TaxID=135947 RepID=A0A124G9D6_9ACTN|nr:hypothetical protein [Actinoplanes awajinensis]KUL28826.1 hypothetical protein ADL15_30465 [Actinoplanes awajinensis subsp. mycoplanecinus]